MNGNATGASQRPILQSKPDRAHTPKARAEAANCLAALWDISKPKRRDRRCAPKTRKIAENGFVAPRKLPARVSGNHYEPAGARRKYQ
jgi:hypothetical protein